MRLSEANALVGKVVILDMIAGARITTKVISIESERDKHFLKCSQPAMIILREAAAQQFQIVGVVPYGIPDFSPQKETCFDVDHIIMAAPAIGGLAEAYAKATSSIIPAGPNAAMPSMDDLAAAMTKLTTTP